MTKVILKTRPQQTTTTPPLFGDLEYIVDRLLKGDKATKDRIAIADAQGRGGYASLVYHLKKAGVTKLKSHDDRIMQSLKLDQEYHETTKADTCHIEQRAGRYRVQMVFEGNRFRKTFDTSQQAREWRDRITILFEDIQQIEAPDESDPQEAVVREQVQAKATASQRKAALREAVKPNPLTGKSQSWSEVLRRPQFALT